MSRGRTLATLVASAAAAALAYALLTRVGALGNLRALVATLVASLTTIVAARAALHPDARGLPRRTVVTVLALGLVATRLALPLGEPTASDDAFRYLWDGRVQAAGVNPYAHAPEADALRELRDERFYPRVFRPDMRTVYPGLAQAWFLLSYWISPSGFGGLKLVLLLNDLVSLLLLVRLLERRGFAPARALLYAWSPLVVVQIFGGCHLDGLLVPWLLASLLLADERPFFAGAALGASAMVRPITALCAPSLAARRPLREGIAAAAGFFVAVALLVAPYAAAGAKMLESLMVYGRHWRFNDSLFRLAERLSHDAGRVRTLVYGAVAAGAVGIGYLPVRRDAPAAAPSPDRAARYALALGLYLALAPTVYPWYFVGIAALLALCEPTLALALPALVTLSDLVWVDGVVGGQWTVPWPALVLEYAGLYGLVARALWRRRLRRSAAV